MDKISQLVEALRCLPGVGPKSAQRMVYFLLKHQRQRGLHLAKSLEQAMSYVTQCEDCNNFCDETKCNLCLNPNREQSTLCVVDSPTDILAIEHSQAFKGRYFVLMGKISPLDGLGPAEIGLPKLKKFIIQNNIQEVIMAFSANIEGQTTMHFISEMLKGITIRTSQLAQGIPTGGELEYLDGNTITSALKHRAEFNY